MLKDFKDEDFDSKIKNEDISVIQFSAAWCGPCKVLSKTIESMREAGAEVALCLVLVNKTVRNEIEEIPLRGIIRAAVV